MPEFLALIGKPTRNQIILANYQGHTFRCACGVGHVIDQSITLLCEGYWRLIPVCPLDNKLIANARARMILIDMLGGIADGYGTRIESHGDQAMFDVIMAAATDR